jgi:drug/metabolite transporter (DMT)-like permease
LNSLIPIILILITLAPFEILFYRTLIAAFLLKIWFIIKKSNQDIDYVAKSKLIGSGFLVFCFWGLSFLCVKMSTASVYLVSLATSPIWISLMQNIENPQRRQPFQFLTSLNAAMGIYIIYNSDFQHGIGMAIGITAAFFGSLLTITSSHFSKHYPALVVTYYQMGGSWLASLIFLPIYIWVLDYPFSFTPSFADISLVGLLAFTFSIYAYAVFIGVMKTISPFVVALVSNLSPLYGILIALLVFGKDEKMNVGFYIGAFLILTSVFSYPVLINYMKSYAAKKHKRTRV